eukprot:389383_1
MGNKLVERTRPSNSQDTKPSLSLKILSSLQKPTVLTSDDHEASDRLRQEIIVYGYIQTSTNKYDIIIPIDIIKLCLLFYQTHFEWTINLSKNKTKSIYNALFEISRLGTDIIATMNVQFEIKKYNSMLIIKVKDIKSDKYRDTISTCRIYCHVKCNELNYEWKHTTTNINRTPTICAFSKVPNGIIEFDCYSEILSKPIMKVYKKYKLYSFAKYKWDFNEMVINDMLNNIHRRFYSPNFNDGCFCLSMYNNKMHPKDTCRVLKIQLLLLNDECIKKTCCIEGIISIFDVDKQCYEFQLPSGGSIPFMHDNATATAQVRIDRNVVVKCIEVTFKT